MPFFPESLYRLSPRDEQVTWLDPLFFFATAAALNTTVTTQNSPLIVPDGLTLLLKNVNVNGQAGAAQIARQCSFVITNPQGTSSFLIAANQGENTRELRTRNDLNWHGELLVPPTWRITASATFDLGAANNIVQTIIAGLLIPVGNIQRV